MIYARVLVSLQYFMYVVRCLSISDTYEAGLNRNHGDSTLNPGE
jgi:hypothetical protein